MSVTGNASLFRTHFEGHEVTVALKGRIENSVALELATALNAAIDRHPTSVVLDLSELDFLGAAGLIAVSNAEKRLAQLGVTLMVQSPSAVVDRLVGIVADAETTRMERGLPRHAHLGPEQPSEVGALCQSFGSTLSSDDLRRVTAIPADPDLVDGALRLIVELAWDRVHGADGVSVSLLRHGVISTVAASDQTIMAMDADQYETGEGPCLDASLKGHWFHSESLDTETRWPEFTPRARNLGVQAILSSPLKAAGQLVGALNMYSRTASTFEVGDQETAAIFAQQASVILSDAHAGVSDVRMALRFQESLRSREVISLAKGILMERHGVTEGSAFNGLLQSAVVENRPLRVKAEAIVHLVAVREASPPRGS